MKVRDLKREGVGYFVVETSSGKAHVFTAEAVRFFKESLGLPTPILVDLIQAHNRRNYDPATDSYLDFWLADLRSSR